MSNEQPFIYRRRRSASFFWLFFINVALAAAALFLFQKRSRENATLIDGYPALVARVNGQPLYLRDLFSAVQISSQKPEITELRQGLKQMIVAEIVNQQAAAEKIDRADVDALWETLRHQFSSDSDLSSALQKAGLSEKEVRQRLETGLRSENWLRKRALVEPTEADLLAWQLAHPEELTLPEAVAATHFAAIFPPRGSAMDFLARGDLVRAAEARLKEGVTFAEIIEKTSEDPAKKVTHGSLGWFTKERMDSDLAKAAFELPIGTISPPVQTRFGFHLLQVSEHRPETVVPPAQFSAEVHQRVQDELELKKLHALLADLVQHAKIQVLDPRLDETSL